MRIENVVALSRGELKNNPPIAYFEDIRLNAAQIKRGDLFLAVDKADIKKAIYNGAYGIVYDSDDVEIIDSEVAFIKVRDVGTAAFSLARYGMLKKSYRFVCVDPVTIEIIKKINSSKAVEFVDEKDIKTLFALMRNDDATMVFGTNEEFLSGLTTDTVDNFLSPKDCKIKIASSTLFETNIFIDDLPFKVRLPEFQIKYLSNAIGILKEVGIDYDVNTLGFIRFFEPIFVDNFLYAKEFGKTAKVVIFAEYADNQILKETINYLAKNTKWAKNLYIFPLSLQNIDEKGIIVTLYGSERELIDMLEENDFNFAFVVGADKNGLIKQKSENTLFSLDFNE